MRLSHLVLLCCLLPASALAADWVPISADYESALYFDRENLKRDGDIVETVLLWDFADMQITRRPPRPYHSATRLTRFDCRIGGRANVETTLWRDRMAAGEIMDVYRTPDAELKFEWVNPDAPGGEAYRQVCAQASR